MKRLHIYRDWLCQLRDEQHDRAKSSGDGYEWGCHDGIVAAIRGFDKVFNKVDTDGAWAMMKHQYPADKS